MTNDLIDESRKPLATIWYLAWPIMLEQVLIMLVNYVDTAMVGVLGASSTAAVALTNPATWLLNGIFAGVSIGFSVPIGRFIGAGRVEDAKRVVRQSVLAIGICGVLMTVLMQLAAPYLPVWLGGEEAIRADATSYLSIISLSYVFNMSVQICSATLRCTGDTRTPLIFNSATNLINMVLNFFFIYPTRTVAVFGRSFTIWGAGLGVSGAAIASAIAIAFSGIMLMRALFLKKAVCRISLRDSFRFDPGPWKDMFRLGTPTAFERMSVNIGQFAMTAIVTTLGTASLAAHSLAITAESITYMPAFGFSAAVTTLVAQSLGANKPELAKRFAKMCVIGCCIFMTGMAFVLFFCGDFLISIATPDAQVILIGAAALQIEALAQPLFAVAQVGSGVLRAAKMTRAPFIICLIGMWAVRIPIAFIMTRYTDLGLAGTWIGMAGDLSVRGLITLVILLRGRWAKGEAPLAPEPPQAGTNG